MPNLIQIITTLIAILSLGIAYWGLRDKKAEKLSKEQSDRSRADALAVAVNEKAVILSSAVDARAIEIKAIQIEVSSIKTDIGVIEEKIAAITKIEERLQQHLVDDATIHAEIEALAPAIERLAMKLEKMYDYLLNKQNDEELK